MNRSLVQMLIPAMLATALASALPGCASDKKSPTSPPAAAKPLTVEDSARIKTTAVVKVIDYTTRVVTLEDPSGRMLTLVAGDQVRRLNEVKVGDTVAAEYVVSLLAELRPPTAEETANPFVIIEMAGRAPTSSAPAAGVGRSARVVTTVQAVDKPKMLVTLRGPSGDTITVQGRKPENIARLKVGDTIVVTFTESLAVGLEKTGK